MDKYRDKLGSASRPPGGLGHAAGPCGLISESPSGRGTRAGYGPPALNSWGCHIDGSEHASATHPSPHLVPPSIKVSFQPNQASAVSFPCAQEAAKAARLRASGASKEAEDSAFVGEGAEADPQLGLSTGAGVQDAEAIEADYQADLGKELRAAAGEDNEDEGEDGTDEDEADIGAVEGAKLKGKGLATAGKLSSATAAADADEADRMKDIMMTRRNRKLYERIKRAQEGKRERVEVLETRKRAVAQKEAASAAPASTAIAGGKKTAAKRRK